MYLSIAPGVDAIVGIIALAIGTVIFIRRAVDPGMRTMPEEFARYYTAARWLLWRRDFRRLYLWERFRERARIFRVPEPADGFRAEQPTSALMLAPLAWMSPRTARQCWTIANAVLYLIAVHLLLDVFSVGDFLPRCLLWTLALVWSPVHECFRRGEASVLMFALKAISLVYITRGQLWLGGGYLGLSLLLKPYAWPFIPVLALRRQLRAVYGAGVVLASIGAVTLPWIGSAVWGQYLAHEAPAAILGGVNASPQFQGIASAIGNALTYDPIHSPHPWANLPMLGAGLQSLTIAFTLVLGLGVASRSRPQLSDPLAFGTTTLTGLIASPAAKEPHYVVALLPALALLARYLGGAGGAWVPWVLVVSVSLLAAPVLPLGEAEHRRGLAKITQYPRLLGSIGLLTMCVLAPMFRPDVWG